MKKNKRRSKKALIVAKKYSNLDRKKRTMLKAILINHDQKEYPVSKATALILFTLFLRLLERAWVSGGADEVWHTIKSK